MVMMVDGDGGDGGDNGNDGDKDKRIKLPYLFPRVTVTNYHRLGGLKQQEFLFFTVLGAQSPKSRCGQCHIPSVGSGENPSFSLLVSGGSWESLAFLDL